MPIMSRRKFLRDDCHTMFLTILLNVLFLTCIIRMIRFIEIFTLKISMAEVLMIKFGKQNVTVVLAFMYT